MFLLLEHLFGLLSIQKPFSELILQESHSCPKLLFIIFSFGNHQSALENHQSALENHQSATEIECLIHSTLT
jgi:hypothetical protein